ncbi:MAG: ATP-binding cassette domain-containing protein, partial [Bacteroidia bacterium]|nr:ATP-binding cassette domain-containing protein [Bacteroidia bacterium]
MDTGQIDKITTKLAELSQQEYNYFDLKQKYNEQITYSPNELGKYIDHIIEKGQQINLTLLKNHIPSASLKDLIRTATFPVLVFRENEHNTIDPVVIYQDNNGRTCFYNFNTETLIANNLHEEVLASLKTYQTVADTRIHGEVIFITAFPLKYILSDYYSKDEKAQKLTPVRRLVRLLSNEQRDIGYIYVYAVVVGLISLSLPLGIQATISLISGGMIFSSVVVLIALVIAGIAIGGALQVMQITLVEILQQRVFAKASFEIAFRVTKIRSEALQKYYLPELMNRFFDVVTVQKGLPKLFVDITGAVIQILFGLILLSFYHPFFLIFSVFLVGVVVAIFYFTGPKGLETSLTESKYKYKIAHWLEELARSVDAFKQAGNTNLPIQKMDELVNSYLFYRKSHFKILLTQFANIVVFKVIVTGGLLIIGTLLVIDRQITLGQFVASEVIIILVVNSVEKLVLSMDTFYDLLTGVEKVAQVTDLPLEKREGLKVALNSNDQGLHIRTKDLKYKYPGNHDYTLNGVDLEIYPGESVCLAGPNDSGKHTLMKVLTGNLDTYEGIITLNHLVPAGFEPASVRDVVNKHLTFSEIFDGTLLDNIAMGRNQVHYRDVLWAIQNVGLSDYIASLPEGLYTHIGSSGTKLSGGVVAKILL